MSPSSDEHLEIALKEYNQRVNDLEGIGSPEELLEAYLGRGCVLSMMEFYVSALSDFDDAAAMIDTIELDGKRVDPGSFIKTYVSRGEIRSTDEARSMADDYAIAATRLNDLKEDSKYYDRRKIVFMCIDCCEDLVDEGFSSEVNPYMDKLFSLLVTRDDDWSRNRYLEALNLRGQSLSDDTHSNEALEHFSDAVDVGTSLLEKGTLDDMMALVFPLISRGDIEQEKGLMDQYLLDRKAAITLLEELLSINKLDNIDILVNLNQDLANSYLTLNKMKEAEEYLMKNILLNMNGSKEYIRDYTNRKMD